MKKVLPVLAVVLIFVLGLGIMLYPTIANYVNARSQTVAIDHYEEAARANAAYYEGLLEQAQARFPGLRGRVVAVRNDFFGHTIDVAGLLTGQDLSAQLRAVPDLGRVLIPIHMLRNGENVFLDDYTVPRLSEELGCPVEVVGMDGFDLADAVFASCDTVKE